MDDKTRKLLDEIENIQKVSPVTSYRDLVVYQMSYKASVIVMSEIVKKLPPEEKYNLISQLGRSVMAIPRLIAEGYAKRYQRRGFTKYLDDAAGETNETEVSIQQAIDFYPEKVDVSLCEKMIEIYQRIGGKIHNTKARWKSF
jgi:four helix bundle protein